MGLVPRSGILRGGRSWSGDLSAWCLPGPSRWKRVLRGHAAEGGGWSARLLLLPLLGLLSGCAVTRPYERVADPETVESVPAPLQGRALAEALALYGSGISAQMSGAYADALGHFLHVIRLDPQADDAYARASALYLQLNQPDDAVALLRKLCRLKPNDPQPFVWLGAICAAADRRRGSYLAFRRAIQLDPESYEAYLELAMNYVRDNEPEKAILVLERGSARVREPAPLLALLGELYLHKVRVSRNEDTSLEYRRMARQAYERAAELDPYSIPILEQLSALYIVDNRIDLSARVLRRLSELNPDHLPTKKQLALVYGALEQPLEASRILEEIARKTVVDPRAYFYIGELYEKLGQKELAILNFRLASQIDPPEPEPYLHLALLTLEQSPDEAIGHLNDGLEKMPREPRLLKALAYIHMTLEEYAEALVHFRAASQGLLADPDDHAAHVSFLFNFALTAHHARQHDLAARLMQRAARLDPMVLHAYLQYVLQQEDPGQMLAAQRIYATMIEPFPEQRKALLTNLALLFCAQYEYQKALELFKQAEHEAVQREQTARLTDQFYYWYGVAHERLGHIDRAAELLKQAIALNAENAAAYNHLAYMWAERGLHLRQAEAYVLQALRRDPDNPAFLDTYGWVLYQRRDYARSEVQLRKALDARPEDPLINEHYGDVLHRLNRTHEAMAYWQKAYDLDPHNRELAERLREMGVRLETTAQINP